MKALLDTRAFLWWNLDAPQLSASHIPRRISASALERSAAIPADVHRAVDPGQGE